jgi:transposase
MSASMATPIQTPVSKVPSITAQTPMSALPTEVATLQQMVLQLLGQINEKTRENFDLQCQLDWLKRQLFGRKSETMDPNQRLLFADLFEKLQGQLEQRSRSESPASAPASAPKVPPANRPSRRNGRVPLPAALPRVPEYLDPDPRLTENMRCIGEDITEILEYIPAGFYVRQIIRRKYAPSGGQGSVVMAPLPPLPIEKGRPGPGVLAYLITSKYCEHLPLYRLEQIFARHGLQIPRTTQCDWVRDGADLLEAIALAMKRRILASGHLFTDDTHIPIQDKSRTQVREGYLWPYIDRAHNVYFDYTTTRSREGPERMLQGYRGYVQADAFHGYDNLYGEGKATEVGCWGHARRKFDEAKQTDPLRANQMLALIAQLYVVEDQAQAEHRDAEGVKALRQKFSKPILDSQIKPLLDAWSLEVLPKSPIGKAVTYALNQWAALNRYLENGFLCIDNSLSERIIKLVALGRKNWLFSGSDEGARRAAILYSLIASCKLCGIDPFVYLRDVLERINTHPAHRIDELTPPQWKELFLSKISLPRFPARIESRTA